MSSTRGTSLPPLLVALCTALAYALVGWLSLRLAPAPTYASPIFPPAGIALAVALAFGRPALMGTVLGSLAVNLLLAAERGALTSVGVLAATLIGLGAGAQAAAGAWLVRSFVAQPLTLAEPADLARFYALGALSCLVSCSVATAALLATGLLAPAQALASGWTWWVGDTLGVLIGAPIALTLIGRPRPEWARRRVVVALPMLLASVLLALATAWINQAHEQRLRTAFERDAWSLADRLESQLRGPRLALLALHGLFATQHQIEAGEMERASRSWLGEPLFLVAVGYSERVRRAEVPAFEARARAEGPVADYRVFDREDGGAAPGDDGVVAIRFIEPLAPNRRALGVNALSIPAARAAIERAAASGEAVATAGFRLTQGAVGETGTVLYRALYRGEPQDAPARQAAFAGVVFVTLRLDAMVNHLFKNAPPALHWCLVDVAPATPMALLAGPPGCDTSRPAGLAYTRALQFGTRSLELRVNATPAGAPALADGGGWLFSIIGLLATSLLGALLLTVSGRQQRIEAAVDARTADLRDAGRALRDSEERLRGILDNVPIGVVSTDADGRVREANPSLLRMLGLAATPEPAPTLADLAVPADRAEVQQSVAALASGAQALVRTRVRLCGAGDHPLWVQMSLSGRPDEDGRTRRLIGVLEDISEHLLLEMSERAREQAEMSSRAKSEFVGRMSHELRTPLNAMLGFAQLLGRDARPSLAPQHLRWAAQIQDAGWHLLNMINDTLDLSMIESGSMRLTPVTLDLGALLDATLDLVAAPAERRQVVLAAPQLEAGARLVIGDETRVKQVLTNLLSNAVKYNVDGGRVEVSARRAGDRVQLAVRDTGIGLTTAQAEGLFQPFNRLGREHSSIEGTGIGLVISRRLAELMNGALALRATDGSGTTLVLELPAAAASDAGQAAGDAPLTSSALYRQRHVLCVEDNDTNVLLIRGVLAQRPQIVLTVASLGLDALAAVRSRRPDLMLLDMHLPDIDGMDLLQHLKTDDATAAIPVLVLSADATRERIECAMTAGAAGYLLKPLDLSEFLSLIDEILEQADTRWA